MGESKKDALRVNFDRKLKLEFHGVKVTSDAGLLAYREIDDVFGLMDMVAWQDMMIPTMPNDYLLILPCVKL